MIQEPADFEINIIGGEIMDLKTIRDEIIFEEKLLENYHEKMKNWEMKVREKANL